MFYAGIVIDEGGVSALVLGFLWKRAGWNGIFKARKITDWDAGSLRRVARLQIYTSDCDNLFKKSGPFSIDEKSIDFEEIVSIINERSDINKFPMCEVNVSSDSKPGRGLFPKHTETRVLRL